MTLRPLLLRAINAMETIYGIGTAPGRGGGRGEILVGGRSIALPEELLQLGNAPQRDSLKTLARLIWQSATMQKRSTAWFLRNYSPEASIVFLLCEMSGVPLSRLMAANLSEAQFCRLTSVMARLTNSTLEVMETPENVAFEVRLAGIRSGRCVEVGFCDWVLSDEEIEAAKISGIPIMAVGAQ